MEASGGAFSGVEVQYDSRLVTKPTYAAGTVAMLVTMAVLTGCGGGTDTGPMRATLTPDGCAYEGDTSPAPGVFNVEVRNQTPFGASFALWELADGSTVEEIEEIYRMAIREHERTGTLPGESTWTLPWPPPLKRTVSVTMVGLEGSSQLPANERTGRYVILCEVRRRGTGQTSDWFPLRVYVAAELDVGPTAN